MAKSNEQKAVRLAVGAVLLVLGVALILMWWTEIAAVFRAVLALALALGGLLVMYTARD